jgi:Ser/Thr protein kinase RdoA (MazF antagonist)
VDETVLGGGNASGRVVKVGHTVRKPWAASTPSVVSYMAALRDAGVDLPAVVGRDERGRLATEYVPGQLAIDRLPLRRDELRRVGAMVRAIHDASTSFRPPADAVWTTAIPAPDREMVCHNDLAPWNLIVGERWVFIDWDAAAPSTRLWDLAYAAQAFCVNDPGRAPSDAALDLVAFVDGYDADAELRADLPTAMNERALAMYRLLESSARSGREPWASMFTDGHGRHWQDASAYVGRHRDVWADALARS